MIGKLWKAVFGPKGPKRLAVSSLPAYRGVVYDGEKFSGGLGAIDVLFKDLWALRARSAEVFERNPYARGIIRRFVTNVVNTGLHLEASPEERLLGFEEDDLGDWAEDVESRFTIWGKNAYQCDFDERRTFGQLQAEIYREALVAGDVLVVLRQDPRSRNPRVQLISGARVQTPWLQKLPEGTRIEHGVEVDARGRHVAFWITQDDGSFKRLPAYGEKSGRKLAWLVYGTDRRLDEVRGTPLLGLVLQSLKELDRYRDATLRKAVINSMLAMYIKKGEERFGSLPMTGGATKVGTEETIDDKGKPRRYRSAEMIPGLVIDELQYGEEPVPFQVNNTVENYGDFEDAILCAMAWALEVPPEILRLTFSSNYSASQAAISEFKLFLNPTRTRFGEEFCAPIYEEWLLSQVFMNRVPARGLLDAFNAVGQDDIYGAWIANDWSGHVKPALDPVKQTKAYIDQANMGLIDLDRAARESNGTSFDKNIKKLTRQFKKLAEARKPMAELEASMKAPAPPAEQPNNDNDDDPQRDEDSTESTGSRAQRRRRDRAA